jgi:nitrate/TMAO reductase-like tetraheme cytochrome c subunit
MRRSTLALGALAILLGPAAALRAQGRLEQPHGNIRIECNECHSPERWTPVDKTPTFRHARTGFELEGVHRQASCRSCHRSLVFERVGTACADCHKDPHRGEMGPRCESCHTPTTWTNQSTMFRSHNRSRFPMMSVHARLDCQACHRNQAPYQYANTPAECGNCHYSTYAQTVSPNHVQAGFSRRCEDCHNVTANSWHEATFTHPASFPLSGGHGGVTCSRCHTGGTTGPMPTTCVSCHRKDFESTTNPNHPGGGFPVTCEDCHSIVTWRPALFDHSRTAFPLTGAHTRTDCSRCHVNGQYKGTPKDCYSCHKANYDATSSPNHRSAGFATQCQNCHNTGAWKPANFDHNSTRFPLTGAHQKAECAKCHVGGSYTKLPTDCWSCHQAKYAASTNPNHAAGNFPKECQACHSTTAWRPAAVDHNKTRFPLTGAHPRVDCAKCHVGGRYTGTPTDCWSCHQANYTGTTNPNHVASSFPKTCQTCHSTAAWRPATVDHNATRFPLTGAHTRVDCAKCHVGGRYTGTPTDCWSCHQTNYNMTTNPNHVASNFPKTCQSCHSTAAWRPATVDHNATRFPLTGAHTRVDCAKCHVGGRYTGTPTDCYSCHQPDYAGTTNPNHTASNFPTQCKTCHTTTAWKPATFDHDGPYFPIYSGKHRGQWSTCADCHVNAANYKVFECILCHKHSNKTQVDSDHKGRAGYVYASSACYQCHRNGRAGLFGPPRRLP